MTNIESFKASDKYIDLSQIITNTVKILDDKLVEKGHLYKAIWRNDREPGGNVFIFEVERRKGRRKNLITLRPQYSFLRVEVYWSEKEKHYFDIHDPNNISDELLTEIEEMYNKIAF